MLTIVIIMTIIIYGEKNMSKRIRMLLLCLLSLTLGVIIYTYYRSDTYIGNLIREILNIEYKTANHFSFISYYIPDYLWAFSLCSGLFAIYPLKPSLGFWWGIVTFIYGVIWEIMQYFALISGTFDIVDIIMYFTAASSVVTINYLFNKEKKK